jgi:hypothetical protein
MSVCGGPAREITGAGNFVDYPAFDIRARLELF